MRGADLKKALPKPLQPQHADALAALRELSAKGEVHRYAKGRTERFFAIDPVATLDRVAPEILTREGPLTLPDLKKAVERAARGHADLLQEWLKSALARKRIFTHGPLPKSRAKRFGSEPDMGLVLRKTLAELKKALVETDAADVSRERVIEVLRGEIGLARSTAAAPSAPSPAAADQEIVRTALRQLASEHRPGTLLLIHDLRARTALDKDRFDAAALALSREGAAVLHHHDHAALLSEEERRQLVADGRGTHYIGIAPRSPS